jgi:hypothetical protein
MTCREAIISDEVMDFIWKIDATPYGEEQLPFGTCVQYVNRNFSVFYRSRDDILKDIERFPLGNFGVPHCYTQLNTESLEETNILSMQNQPALQLRGNGVILGFLDSGFAIREAVFRKADGKTRVLELWDQTDQNGLPPQDMLYGSAYTGEEIDRWLQEGRADLPGADANGHGTKVAAIAAGSYLEEKQFLGAAPEADLVLVKLKQAKSCIRKLQQIPQDSIAYEESDLMLAIRYLDMVAVREKKPLIICLALGSNSGGHTGSSALASYLQDFARRAGRVVVAAGGNEGNKGHHFYGVVPADPGYLDVELRVGEQEERSGFQMNLWGNAPGTFSTEITSPSGEKIPRIFPRIFEQQRYDFIFEKTILDIQYELSEVISGDERLLISFQHPTTGIWRLRIYSTGNLENSFHIWLPITGFISDETYFLRPDPDTTLTEPANSEGALTMAGYQGENDSLWLDASRGYTRANQLKPDLAAPAVGVSTIDRFGNTAILSGSSASAALGAGACALLMEWGIVRGNVPTMDSAAIQRFLIRGAGRPDKFTYPNRNWGYGLLDLYGTFRAIQGIREG